MADKLQQIQSILCDADESVWQWLSNYLHTHAQVSGIKLVCCTVPSSHHKEPPPPVKKKDSVWIPISAMPIISSKGGHPCAQKVMKGFLVRADFNGTNRTAIVQKRSSETCTVFVIDTGMIVDIGYSKITHVSSVVLAKLSGQNYAAVKKIVEVSQKDELFV